MVVGGFRMAVGFRMATGIVCMCKLPASGKVRAKNWWGGAERGPRNRNTERSVDRIMYVATSTEPVKRRPQSLER